MNELTFPYIRKEGIYFVIGAKNTQVNEIKISKRELIILRKKLNMIEEDKFYWKSVL